MKDLFIPRLIHYVWLGGKEKPNLMCKCMRSWRKMCPDYQLMEWGDKEASKIRNVFLQEAIARKKWAFAADFLRVYVLKHYGGFYLDSDLELIKSIDDFLQYKFVIGFENEHCPSTALIGSEKDGRIVNALLEYYKYRKFVLSDGSLDLTPNPLIFKNVINKYFRSWDEVPVGESLVIGDREIIFPINYFNKPLGGG